MNGRERLTATLRKRDRDRMPWTTLVDGATVGGLPENLRGNGGIDFYRHLGADIFLLNGWGTPFRFASPELLWPSGVKVSNTQDPENPEIQRQVWSTRKGELVGITRRSHPVKYPVDTIEAVRLYREIWEGVEFVERDDRAAMAALDSLVGGDGVVTRFWGPSTIPRLLETDMGTENFYLLHADHPEEVDGLIRVMHRRELQAFEILARGPWESATLMENTSTYYISPWLYKSYNMPHQRDFVQALHGAGKPALLHMCGHVHDLLPLIRETGCDGIHTLTPPPTGNTPWEEALDVIGEDLVILGCLDPTVWISGDLDGIGPKLDRLVTQRLRRAHFVLNPMADGIPVPMERFEAVRRWMERNP